MCGREGEKQFCHYRIPQLWSLLVYPSGGWYIRNHLSDYYHMCNYCTHSDHIFRELAIQTQLWLKIKRNRNTPLPLSQSNTSGVISFITFAAYYREYYTTAPTTCDSKRMCTPHVHLYIYVGDHITKQSWHYLLAQTTTNHRLVNLN
jgi:hypothetical protein